MGEFGLICYVDSSSLPQSPRASEIVLNNTLRTKPIIHQHFSSSLGTIAAAAAQG